MSNWVFIVTNQKTANGQRSADEIYQRLMKEQVWGLGEKTPNRTSLRPGDRVVFYLGHPLMQFAGTAVLKSPTYRRSPQQRERLRAIQDILDPAEYGIDLEEITIWPSPKDAKQLVPVLDFIENKKFWGVYFQGGVRQMSDKDYYAIASPRDLPISQQIQRETDIADESEFALESHLEEFLDKNWKAVFGDRMRQYSPEPGIPGRQFPAGEWNIDFLCVDEQTKDFVVIELKRGKTSDAVVGQIARYMVWVKENLATKGQRVRGIVIAKEADESLKTAVKISPDISIKTYAVKFDLRDGNEKPGSSLPKRSRSDATPSATASAP